MIPATHTNYRKPVQQCVQKKWKEIRDEWLQHPLAAAHGERTSDAMGQSCSRDLQVCQLRLFCYGGSTIGILWIDHLSSGKVAGVTYHLHQHFARYVLPIQATSVNCRFCCDEFTCFVQQYGFQLMTSQRNLRSYGRLQNTIVIAQRIMIKSIELNSDTFLAFLEWWNVLSSLLPKYYSLLPKYYSGISWEPTSKRAVWGQLAGAETSNATIGLKRK